MPVACYANPFPVYQPAMRIITAISQTNPAQVTTSFNHQYSTGLIVRLDVPLANGMRQITSSGQNGNGPTYQITVTGPATFTVPIDSTNFQAYVNNQCCSVVPVGEQSSLLNLATQNVLPYSAT